MDLSFSKEDEQFREEIRSWLEEQLSGEFKAIRGRGGPGDEHSMFKERQAWNRKMGEAGWNCIAWPKEYGGRDATLHEQVIFNEEYARARAPGRLGHIGETLAGPTIIAFGTEAQKQRFLPGIVSGDELWCQGYSEPNAGSDLANVQTRGELRDGKWHITGQKTWTSLAQWSDWCFVITRTSDGEKKHHGLSYILVPMDQDGVEIRPIKQLTGTSEFNEVFFDDAIADEDNIVGGEGNGWKVAMATLAFERGTSTLGQQLDFKNELEEIIQTAKDNGAINDPVIRQRIAQAYAGIRIMRLNALRTLSVADQGSLSRDGMISKLYWATWHRDLGKLAMDVLGPEADIGDANDPSLLTPMQRMFLFTRSDTIYAGSNQIQRNIIGERALGLPRNR